MVIKIKFLKIVHTVIYNLTTISISKYNKGLKLNLKISINYSILIFTGLSHKDTFQDKFSS